MRAFVAVLAIIGSVALALFAWAVVVSAVKVPSPPTALMVAASDGDLAAVNALLAKGVDVDEPRGHYTRYVVPNPVHGSSDHRYGETALLLAIERRRPAIVRALLDAGADTSVRDSMGRGIWDYAVYSLFDGPVDQFFILADRLEMPPDLVDTVLYATANTGNRKLLNFALSRPSSTVARESALCSAARRADVEMFERLLQTFETVPPVSLGCAMGAQPEFRMGMLKLMVNAGVSLIADEGMSPLSSALLTVQLGSASAEISPELRELLEYLLEQGADPLWVPPRGSSALELARSHGQSAVVHLFEDWETHGGITARRRIPHEPGTRGYFKARDAACHVLICVKTARDRPCFGACFVPVGESQPTPVEGKPVGMWVKGSGPEGQFGDDLRYKALIRADTDHGMAECAFEFDASAFGTRTQACDPRLGQVQVSIGPNRDFAGAE